MDITTNRVDAMNHYGIAREAAAIYGIRLASLDTFLPQAKLGPAFPVRIEAPESCGRFTARILRSVNVKQYDSYMSAYRREQENGFPAWDPENEVARRFHLLGQKLISNAVDATNYVTLAMGHPTHAFDLDKLEGGIVVRRARKGEKLRTLDGVERTLDLDDMVVADERKALGLAGVMGGWDSMITPETKNILVEAAWFDPAAVRRMSRRHGIHSDASHRFERGADFNAPPVASALVSRIILESGGYLEGELTDVIVPEAEARTAKRAPVKLAVSEAQRILGTTEDGAGITESTCTEVLTALGCTLAPQGSAGEFVVTLPSWRLDLEREIDLIEEIARVFGYNRFANTLPAFSGTVLELPLATKESAVRELLLASGYHEAVSSTFCSAADAVLFAPQPGTSVAVGNPLNDEAGMLRPSLLPGMLTMLAHNLNRNVNRARLFEMGTVFSGSPERVEERPGLSFGATGEWNSGGPHQPARGVDFYDLKGSVEALLERFAKKSVYFDAFPGAPDLMPPWLHPGRAARCVVDGSTVGYFGQLHPAEADRRKLRQPVYLGEVYLQRLYALALRQPAARELSRFQPVQRDFSFFFPDEVKWQAVATAIGGLEILELAEYRPAEIFRDAKGHSVPAGQYSMLVSTTFQAPDRTLRDDELQSWSEAIVRALEALGGKQRVQ